MATKKIDRSRFEAGKVALPKKLAFLSTEKVDYLSVTDRDGELSVELPAAALSRLVKARGELKTHKSEAKSVAKGHADSLAAEQAAHAETKAALAKAERKVASLTKKIESAAASSAPAAQAAPVKPDLKASPTGKKAKPAASAEGTAPEAPAKSLVASKAPNVKVAKAPKPARSATEPEKVVHPSTEVSSSSTAPAAAELATPEPKAPKRVSTKKVLAQAVEAVVAAPIEAPASLPMA